MYRFLPLISSILMLALFSACLMVSSFFWVGVILMAGLTGVGLYDVFQTRHTLWRNFPIAARIRWIAEELRPFFRAYIVESDTEGRPFNHEERAMVYRRAKNVTSVEPFGSQLNIDRPPYEWLSHSVAARHPAGTDPRVKIGAPGTAHPYSASLLNISAMSFGSLGAHAIEALNRGAAKGGFYHDTGEGGVSRYHRAGGGDLVWELGSGYFGCRTKEGRFDPDRFADVAQDDQIKMIEIKLSQGAKPGHGGVLPGNKVTEEIAEARGIPVGQTCFSPAAHTAFSTPKGLMEFVAQLRELSGGKPVGMKLCVGNRWEVLAICKAMLETGIHADFIVVDGAEGGTGAAPAEFMDHIGAPLRQGLVLVRNALVGCDLKRHVKLGASGKQISAFSMAASMALGADWINTARGFMFSLGCIQSLNCHNNTCPTGIATTDKGRQRGLVIPDKAERVYNFHRNTISALMEVVGAAGCEHPSELTPRHIMHRVTEDIAEPGHRAYKLIEPGALISGADDTHLAREWSMAQTASFAPLRID
ncbi:MAG: FMN-binding glutamate synthase family protein [Henriciella sp.]|jgi:glutamate synthase domain-containing protein 2|uniref:FMN-binding glutamate synthase family protein n=1 Tax=Henriciella sp. TaxID=1968823 RepID=UPI000C0D2EC5|nr:FMN-binding glutamate synthase family protein [Henriciella sp.]MAN75469.1 FMN-binding glutamate synthase family protein [Henriciella sp.]MBF34969.1 FMN-binding glutamate synthase family protein [Hyphomonadaceae bacterium]PHR77271.1 MAG: FMN-binding glutamate synthase family protein [Henriciella sp.]|tara:strand:- start:14129 stop:15724 length:1596 start_codon:yes stop_codon:yes gene_type:complete